MTQSYESKVRNLNSSPTNYQISVQILPLSLHLLVCKKEVITVYLPHQITEATKKNDRHKTGKMEVLKNCTPAQLSVSRTPRLCYRQGHGSRRQTTPHENSQI